VNCKNLALGCVEVLPLDELEDHLEKTCTKRVVECRLDCGTKVACDKRTDHEVGLNDCTAYKLGIVRPCCFATITITREINA
jgi:hypothetical protein